MCRSLQERQKKTLTPNWDEDKWLLVQEPKTQAMRLQCFDHDALNVKVCTIQSPAWATSVHSPPSHSYLSCSALCDSEHFSVAGLGQQSLEADLELCTKRLCERPDDVLSGQSAPLTMGCGACCRRW